MATTERDIWGRTLALLLIGFICYGFSGVTVAALPIPTDGSEVIRIHGSNTVGAKLAPMLIAGLFEAQGFHNVRITPTDLQNEQRISAQNAEGLVVHAKVAAHGTSTGFTGLRTGEADFAAASRPIKASERTALASLGDLHDQNAEQVIAIDGLAIIVHPGNPVAALTTEELARLFAGEVTNWQALGGPDLAVQLHARDDQSGTYDTFKGLVLGAQNKTLAATARRYESNDELSRIVASNPGAIGFVGLASVHDSKPVAISNGGSQAMLPSRESIATEDYPLSRRLFLYAGPEQQSSWVRALIEFTHSIAGQAIVERSGYVSQTITAIEQPAQANMPVAYQQLAMKGQRLTVNFRFDEGSARLDNKAQRDIQRAADYLKRQGKLHHHAVLVGFGDAKSDPDRAALLSKLRAMAVRLELHKSGAEVNEIIALGDELPIASNTKQSGRIKNRRVEMWLY